MKGRNEKSQISESNQSSNQEGFWNVQDATGYLKVRASTVYSLVEQNEIPHYRVGRQIRFRKSEIDKWMEEHKRPAVDVRVEAKNVFRSIEKKGDLDVNAIVKKTIEDERVRRYTSQQGKPDQIKGLRKEVEDGYLP